MNSRHFIQAQNLIAFDVILICACNTYNNNESLYCHLQLLKYYYSLTMIHALSRIQTRREVNRLSCKQKEVSRSSFGVQIAVKLLSVFLIPLYVYVLKLTHRLFSRTHVPMNNSFSPAFSTPTLIFQIYNAQI